MSSTPEPGYNKDAEELKVTFHPPLFLQRRIWILDVLRAEKVTQLLDVGCGEGQLLAVLCQPAPWLPTPPLHLLSPAERGTSSEETKRLSPVHSEEIPSIHPTHIMGVDTCSSDLEFAVKGTAPAEPEMEGADRFLSCATGAGVRWENLEAKVWKGGLESINKEFVDIECIVSTEVIEHLGPDALAAFAPVLLGVYHPRLFLVTTPSYTFNARFTAPTAPPTARSGYPDPTKRTNRVFRHDDHKFEWTREEFSEWCETTALEWGYTVQISSVGRSVEPDEWGRDEELGGATSVALFRRGDLEGREQRGREALQALCLNVEPHELLATHRHLAHPSSEKPESLKEIGLAVKKKMEEFREGFMRVEDLWFEQDIAVLCGGWIEFLVRAVEDSDFLVLKRDEESVQNRRGNWLVELIGGVPKPQNIWSLMHKTSVDNIPSDWRTGEEESSDGDYIGSTDMEGDISWNGSEDEDDNEETESVWSRGDWGDIEKEEVAPESGWGKRGWSLDEEPDIPANEDYSTTGWDGDESEDTT